MMFCLGLVGVGGFVFVLVGLSGYRGPYYDIVLLLLWWVCKAGSLL